MLVGNFIFAVATILHYILTAYVWVVVVSALISWVNPDPYNKIVQILRLLTQPVYDKIRHFIPTIFGGIDIAPIIVILGIQFLDLFVVRSLFGFAATF